jgi:hypothetical protein
MGKMVSIHDLNDAQQNGVNAITMNRMARHGRICPRTFGRRVAPAIAREWSVP